MMKFYWILVIAALTSLNGAADEYGPPSSTGTFKEAPLKKPPPEYQPSQPYTPHGLPPKPALPPMEKPFGMPGVIGLQNGKWAGTDYLGFLSDHIGIDVEILKTEDVHLNISDYALDQLAGDVFEKQDLTPRADVKEGPPLPFLHILIIVYPYDKQKYVVFGSSRLFEQIQVLRKDFIPAGYWQGITWENQDVTLANSFDLDTKVKAMVDKLSKAFASRYRQYNLSKEGMPEGRGLPPPPKH